MRSQAGLPTLSAIVDSRYLQRLLVVDQQLSTYVTRYQGRQLTVRMARPGPGSHSESLLVDSGNQGRAGEDAESHGPEEEQNLSAVPQRYVPDAGKWTEKPRGPRGRKPFRYRARLKAWLGLADWLCRLR